MARSTNRISKFWVYFPIYLIVWGSSVFGLYYYLNAKPNPPTTQSVAAPTPKEDWAVCFDAQKVGMEGIFSITPSNALSVTMSKLSSDCIRQICSDMSAVNTGDLDIIEFYEKGQRDVSCLSKVLASATEYHQTQLLTHNVLPLFYNAGQSKLSGAQQRDLSFFLNIFRKKAAELELLIIGRASATGTRDANKRLSRARAKYIVDFIEARGINKLTNSFVYFGSDPPQLNRKDAEQLQFDPAAYQNISFGKGRDEDYKIRLNQSVLLIISPKEENAFGLGQ